MAPNMSGQQQGDPIHRESDEDQELNLKKARPIGQKEKYVLGNYRDAVIPMAVLMSGFIFGFFSCLELPPDPRTANWFMMETPAIPFILAILYVLFSTVWGPKYMRDKEPLEIKPLINLYNVIQIVFSGWMFYEIGMSGWFFDYSYTCQPCDYSQKPQAVRMTVVAWYFFMSKLLDFMDTIFFVARKKNSHISILHVVHHSCMVVSMWFGVKYIPGGQPTFMGFINSLVHTIMYTYYFLASLGPALQPFLWWKKYLTTFQLVQFVCIFINSSLALLIPSCKAMPTGFGLWTIVYAITFFALFMNFYRKAYNKNKSSPKPKSENEKKEIIFEKVIPLKSLQGTHSPRIRRTLISTSINAS